MRFQEEISLVRNVVLTGLFKPLADRFARRICKPYGGHRTAVPDDTSLYAGLAVISRGGTGSLRRPMQAQKQVRNRALPVSSCGGNAYPQLTKDSQRKGRRKRRQRSRPKAPDTLSLLSLGGQKQGVR